MFYIKALRKHEKNIGEAKRKQICHFAKLKTLLLVFSKWLIVITFFWWMRKKMMQKEGEYQCCSSKINARECWFENDRQIVNSLIKWNIERNVNEWYLKKTKEVSSLLTHKWIVEIKESFCQVRKMVNFSYLSKYWKCIQILKAKPEIERWTYVKWRKIRE